MNNVRAPGQYFDQETGLHYNYYRSTYNPATGRYEEVDPIGMRGGINLYSYANQNPLTFTDPLGLDATIPFPGTGAGAGAGAGIGEIIIGACARLTIIGGILFPSSISQCQDFPKPKGCDGTDDDSCEALYQSILKTCSGLSGRKKFKCFEAARISREQCYQERGK